MSQKEYLLSTRFNLNYNKNVIYLLIFIVEVIALFFSSRLMTKSLSFLPINVISFLFLPGIIVHELSHLLFASLLFVPAGEIEFMPKIEGQSIKLGSVSIGKTDPIRRFLIGVSPFIFGVLVISAVLYFTKSINVPLYVNLLIFYTLFVIGNTMFSSQKDMEGALVLLILIAILSGALFFSGARIPQEFFTIISSKGNSLSQIDYFLPIVIALDLFIFFLGTRNNYRR